MFDVKSTTNLKHVNKIWKDFMGKLTQVFVWTYAETQSSRKLFMLRIALLKDREWFENVGFANSVELKRENYLLNLLIKGIILGIALSVQLLPKRLLKYDGKNYVIYSNWQ